MVFDSKAYDELFPREQPATVQNNADDSMLNEFRTEIGKPKEDDNDGSSGADEPSA